MALPGNICDNELAKFVETTNGETAVRAVPTSVKAENAIYQINPLLNGGSKEMAVDGSVGDVDFTFSPSAGEVLYLESVSLTIEDKGKMDLNAFGAIPAGLANGVLITIQSKATVYDIVNLFDNGDISNSFVGAATPTSTGWFDTDDAFIGERVFNVGQMVLRGDDSDFFRVRIRDDLSALDFFRSSLILWRVIA